MKATHKIQYHNPLKQDLIQNHIYIQQNGYKGSFNQYVEHWIILHIRDKGLNLKLAEWWWESDYVIKLVLK